MLTRTIIPLSTANLLIDSCRLAYDYFLTKGKLIEVPNGYSLIENFTAVALKKEEHFGVIIENDENIVVAFRGSLTDKDWLTDFDIHPSYFPYIRNGGYVHNGFLSIYESCRHNLLDKLNEMDTSKHILITGHSLGGALSSLLAADLSNQLRSLNQTAITFASPKVGNSTFAEQYSLLVPESYRFVNLNDIVPLLPPSSVKFKKNKETIRYTHLGQPLTFSTEFGSTALNHSTEAYKRGVLKLLG